MNENTMIDEKTVNEIMHKPKEELEKYILDCTVNEFKEIIVIFVDAFKEDLKETKRDKEELFKSINEMIATLSALAQRDDISADDRKYFVDCSMQLINMKAQILKKDNILKYVDAFLAVGLEVGCAFAAYLIKTKIEHK